jgi:hypothetical protein
MARTDGRTTLPTALVRQSNPELFHRAGRANGQKIAYVYYGCQPGRRSAAKLLSKDEARTDRQVAGAIEKALEPLAK